MDILSFNKITKPIYEGGATISLKPESEWFFEVRRTDGTIRYPFGDKWIKNVVLDQFKNQVLTHGGFAFRNTGTNTDYDFLNLFFQHSQTSNRADIEIGTSNTAAVSTQTALQAFSKSDNGYYFIGNSATISPTTGDLVVTIKKTFAFETGTITYREAGLKVNPVSQTGVAGIVSPGLLINRVTFADLILNAGEQLIATVAIRVPTLTVTGQTISISAQNGLNISGTLRLVGTTNRNLGINTLTSGGTLTNNSTGWGTIFPTSQTASGISTLNLSTNSTHAAFNTASSGLNTNAATTSGWATYTTNNFFRDYTGQWASGGSNITFQSINLITSNNGTSGYQLLCTSSQTKVAASTLSLSLRFSLS
jgi:hypothetical protein